MHRFMLSSAARAGVRHSLPQSLMARSISTSSTIAAEASPAVSAPPGIALQANKLMYANNRRSSSASFIRFERKKKQGPSSVKTARKKGTGARAPHKNVAPLLTRLWGRNGRFQTLAPEDWANIVLNNRRRLLQLKEREQYRAWERFQAKKSARLAWLRENGEEISAEMRERILQREAHILAMTADARKQINAPIPPLPLPPKHQSDKAAAHSRRAKAEPQTYLRTQYKADVWRVFTFRLTHYHSHILHRQQEKFRELAQRLGLSPSRPTYLPRRFKKFNIIRSPHVDKTSREQYETRFYSLKIRISPSVDKFYAVMRLHELAFRLINGNVKMRVETPAHLPIESVVFAPNPLKAENGHVPMQQYAVRDSPGIENILYKFDQHQFPFLADWEEEILDDKFRGIYPPERDASRPYPLKNEDDMGLKLDPKVIEQAMWGARKTEEGASVNEEAPSLEAAGAGGSGTAAIAEGEDGEVFDENGEFSTIPDEDADFEEDEVEEAIAQQVLESDIEDDRDAKQRIEDLYDSRVVPLVKRKRHWDK